MRLSFDRSKLLLLCCTKRQSSFCTIIRNKKSTTVHKDDAVDDGKVRKPLVHAPAPSLSLYSIVELCGFSASTRRAELSCSAEHTKRK